MKSQKEKKRKEKKGKKVKESFLLRAERGGGIIRFLVGEKNQVHISRLRLNFLFYGGRQVATKCPTWSSTCQPNWAVLC